ncbi:hypothetical protein CY34DRAFT_808229 [Suillus luteus UH-Slu-Lm8-n1]|uniref:Uncharacterized protein n=1 Tax=Suillus luteus UH-Slu-Lm8-n1 TaxID=930992 RepID=A0A0D0ACT6_9AGAM|nr:hypothetical protein CY34DRAFT_808229 [Suillus luteus UH-Slu-Lm8-n1]
MPAYSVSPTTASSHHAGTADACNIPSRQTEKLEVCNKDYRKYCEYVLEMKSASINLMHTYER